MNTVNVILCLYVVPAGFAIAPHIRHKKWIWENKNGAFFAVGEIIYPRTNLQLRSDIKLHHMCSALFVVWMKQCPKISKKGSDVTEEHLRTIINVEHKTKLFFLVMKSMETEVSSLVNQVGCCPLKSSVTTFFNISAWKGRVFSLLSHGSISICFKEVIFCVTVTALSYTQ